MVHYLNYARDIRCSVSFRRLLRQFLRFAFQSLLFFVHNIHHTQYRASIFDIIKIPSIKARFIRFKSVMSTNVSYRNQLAGNEEYVNAG